MAFFLRKTFTAKELQCHKFPWAASQSGGDDQLKFTYRISLNPLNIPSPVASSRRPRSRQTFPST